MKKIESLSKEVKDIKKNQMELLELSNTITKVKCSVDGLSSRTERKKKEQTPSGQQNTKDLIFMPLEFWNDQRENRTEKVLHKIMA